MPSMSSRGMKSVTQTGQQVMPFRIFNRLWLRPYTLTPPVVLGNDIKAASTPQGRSDKGKLASPSRSAASPSKSAETPNKSDETPNMSVSTASTSVSTAAGDTPPTPVPDPFLSGKGPRDRFRMAMAERAPFTRKGHARET